MLSPFNGIVALLVAKILRCVVFSSTSVIIFLFLGQSCALTPMQISSFVTSVMLGNLIKTTVISIRADGWGRKKTLIVSAAWMVMSNLLLLFAALYGRTSPPSSLSSSPSDSPSPAISPPGLSNSSMYALILAVGLLGIVSPTGKEMGSFEPVEQSSIVELSLLLSDDEILLTKGQKKEHAAQKLNPNLFTLLSFLSYIAESLGSLTASLVLLLPANYFFNISYGGEVYTNVIFVCTLLSVLTMITYFFIPNTCEVPHDDTAKLLDNDHHPIVSSARGEYLFGLHSAASRDVVIKLSLLFMMDAFGGGFIITPILVLWFQGVFHTSTSVLGYFFILSNLVSSISMLLTGPLIKRFGAIKVMVFSHVPSSLSLMCMTLTSSPYIAAFFFLAKQLTSQMDVPARNYFISASVESMDQSAAKGVTNAARSVGVALSGLIVGFFLSAAPNTWEFSAPFIICGCVKITYDALVWMAFSDMESHTSMKSGREKETRANEKTALLGETKVSV